MGALFSYSLQVGVFLIFSTIIYNVFMARERQFVFNRFVILAVVVLSLCAPALLSLNHGSTPVSSPHAGAGVDVGAIVEVVSAAGLTPVAAAHENVFCTVLVWVYLVGMIFMAVRLLWTVGRLWSVISGAHKINMETCTLVLVPGGRMSPFSWGRYVVMSDDDYAQSGSQILVHEQCHLACRHWADLLFMELVKILCWYNPAVWMLQNELKDVHEYQADEAVIASGADIRSYQMLLIKKAVGVRFPSLVNSLNHSKLKKRITMMYNQKSSVWGRMRSLALLPAAAAAVLVVSIPSVASAVSEISETRLVEAGVFTPAEAAASAAVESVSDDKVNESLTFVQTDSRPEFPGGEQALYNFLAENMKYPEKALAEGTEGRVVVQFVVSETGKIVNPTVVRSVSKELDAEALRMIGLLPDFVPGSVDGKKVAVTYTLPINFKLSPSDKPSRTVAGSELKGKIVEIKTTKELSVVGNSEALKNVTLFINGQLSEIDALSEISTDRIKSIVVKKDNPDHPDGIIYVELNNNDTSK